MLHQTALFSFSTPGLGSCSSKSFTQACGLVRNVSGSWLSGRQPKKLRHWFALCQSKNNPNKSLSPGRACWVCALNSMRRAIIYLIFSRPSRGSFARLPEHCHQGKRVATSLPSLHEDGEV